MAREAAKEKAKSAYIKLACGHLTTWETDEQYSAFRPAKNRFFCEIDGKWVAMVPKPKRPNYSQEPLF